MKQNKCVEENNDKEGSRFFRIRIKPLQSLFSAHNSFSVDPTRNSLNICMGKSAGVVSNSLSPSLDFLPSSFVGADQKSVSVDLRCENTVVCPPGNYFSESLPRQFIWPSYRRADNEKIRGMLV